MALLVLGVVGCTPAAHSLELEDYEEVDAEISVVPFAEGRAESGPPAPIRAVRSTPPAPPRAEYPADGTLDLRVYLSDEGADGDGERCELHVQATGLPAYDPATDRVVTLERFRPQINDDLGTLDLVWFDAASGEVVERIELAAGSSATPDDCTRARRRAERGVRRAHHRLRQGSYEPMPIVPLSWIEWPSLHFEALRQAKADALADGEEWNEGVPQYVEAFPRRGEIIVRVRGVEVLERMPTKLQGDKDSTHSFRAHRASGTVLVASIECTYAVSCSCDPKTVYEVLRFRPETLQRIDAYPCTTPDGSDEACLAGSEWLAADVDPWLH